MIPISLSNLTFVFQKKKRNTKLNRRLVFIFHGIILVAGSGRNFIVALPQHPLQVSLVAGGVLLFDDMRCDITGNGDLAKVNRKRVIFTTGRPGLTRNRRKPGGYMSLFELRFKIEKGAYFEQWEQLREKIV